MLNDKCGFTLTELLIVIGVVSIIAAAVIPIPGNLFVSGQLNETASQVIQTIRTAQTRSVSGFNDSAHGVRILSDGYVLFQETDSLFDREVKVDEAVSLTTNLAGNEVLFSKGLGAPNATGIITLSHNTGRSIIITVNPLGTAKEQ